MISLIVAYASNGVIGRNNDLPWYLPADLKRFKQLTTGHTVIMGRKTYESIINRLGHPLPDRQHIVLTTDTKTDYPAEVVVCNDWDGVMESIDHGQESFVIGGQAVFTAALPIVDRIYATEIEQAIEGDVYFPGFAKADWQITASEAHQADDRNPYNYKFVTYERRR